jgi:hypothetical protein
MTHSVKRHCIFKLQFPACDTIFRRVPLAAAAAAATAAASDHGRENEHLRLNCLFAVIRHNRRAIILPRNMSNTFTFYQPSCAVDTSVDAVRRWHLTFAEIVSDLILSCIVSLSANFNNINGRPHARRFACMHAAALRKSR